jgi:uncharacterized membrane protein YeaQ/YmgE (transglycosylase-associated protein family)
MLAMSTLTDIFFITVMANVLLWSLFGLAVGVIGYLFNRGAGVGSFFTDVVSAILGAVVGGFIASVAFGVTISGFDLQSLAMAVGGSLMFIYLKHVFTGKKVT